MSGFFCEYCGKPIEGEEVTFATKYHKACASLADRAKKREWARRKQAERIAARPPRFCAICGKELPKEYNMHKHTHDECGKEKANTRKDWMIRQQAKTAQADAITIAARQSGTTYGKFLAPAVTVEQPERAFTYKQIKALADRNGISYQAQARAMGL